CDLGDQHWFRLIGKALGREGQPLLELQRTGTVEAAPGLARWHRPWVDEEYSVTEEGLRQDFVVSTRPEGSGCLRLMLSLEGARAEPCGAGAKLVLPESVRALTYHQLVVRDALGRRLAARMQINEGQVINILVDDYGATYPVRIDPTFTD